MTSALERSPSCSYSCPDIVSSDEDDRSKDGTKGPHASNDTARHTRDRPQRSLSSSVKLDSPTLQHIQLPGRKEQVSSGISAVSGQRSPNSRESAVVKSTATSQPADRLSKGSRLTDHYETSKSSLPNAVRGKETVKRQRLDEARPQKDDLPVQYTPVSCDGAISTPILAPSTPEVSPSLSHSLKRRVKDKSAATRRLNYKNSAASLLFRNIDDDYIHNYVRTAKEQAREKKIQEYHTARKTLREKKLYEVRRVSSTPAGVDSDIDEDINLATPDATETKALARKKYIAQLSSSATPSTMFQRLVLDQDRHKYIFEQTNAVVDETAYSKLPAQFRKHRSSGVISEDKEDPERVNSTNGAPSPKVGTIPSTPRSLLRRSSRLRSLAARMKNERGSSRHSRQQSTSSRTSPSLREETPDENIALPNSGSQQIGNSSNDTFGSTGSLAPSGSVSSTSSFLSSVPEGPENNASQSQDIFHLLNSPPPSEPDEISDSESGAGKRGRARERRAGYKSQERRFSMDDRRWRETNMNRRDQKILKYLDGTRKAREYRFLQHRNYFSADPGAARMNMGHKLNLLSGNVYDPDFNIDRSQSLVPNDECTGDESESIYITWDTDQLALSAVLAKDYEKNPLDRVQLVRHCRSDRPLCEGVIVSIQHQEQIDSSDILYYLFAKASEIVSYTFKQFNMDMSLDFALDDFFTVDIFTDSDMSIKGVSEYIFMRRYIYVDKIAVPVEFQRRGVGTVLLQRIIKLAESKKKDILLYALFEAVRFYESYGFEKCDEWPVGKGEAGVILRKKVAAPPKTPTPTPASKR
ncbi:hypothetical protein BZG36_00918 [Bifiguratus adelaidae]|uniref:N-acetyltransferase domain-containing protein n=1 Tax=Bifiguratus adelaidae TaxID=1938954 RepID=A0A261Y5J0_9FUNG|nr:hypothetical protein BZG36_00918 [Bifiguratus adelaidae]